MAGHRGPAAEDTARVGHHAAVGSTNAPDAAQVKDALALPLALDFERLAPTLTSGLFDRGDAVMIVRRAPHDAALHAAVLLHRGPA